MSKQISGVVKVGLIGCGGISAAHAKGFLKHKGKIEVVALCDVDEGHVKARAEQLGQSPATFKDWKTMLGEVGSSLDAVDICLPHHLHASAILDAVAAGKHVLCEKPMCMSLAEADRIAQAVDRAGITYMSGHNQLFMPVVQEAKRIIESGEIGRVVHLRSQDCFHATFFATREQWNWRADRKTQGGGELIDTGYHPTYRLLHLAGSPVVAVRANMARFNTPIDGEDTASLSVRFENGALGEVLTSWAFNLPYGTHQIHVTGEKGQVFGSGDTLYVLPYGYTEPAKRQFQAVETFEAEIGHFADCLREGRRPLHSVEEGRAVLEVILKAGESAQGWQK